MAAASTVFTERETPSRGFKGLLHRGFADPTASEYHAVQRVVITLIFLSVAAIVVETVHPLHEDFEPLFDILEWLFLLGFGLEYVAHLYIAEKKLAYVFSIWGLIDLLSIIPSFAAILHVSGLEGFRELRILRVLRTLKLMKLATVSASEAQDLAKHRRSTLALDLQIYFIALFTVMIISATLVYHAEAGMPDTKFTNIPAALWWAVSTVSTTGSPFARTVTVWGRVIAGVTMLAGVALFGILTNVIGRALLTSLFGSSGEDDEAQQLAARRRAQQREAQRQRIAARVQQIGQRIGSGVERVVEAAGPRPMPLPALPVARGNAVRRLLVSALRDSRSTTFRYAQALIALAILVSVGAIILESVDWIADQYGALLHATEWLVVAIFTVEYAAQIYVAENRPAYLFSFWGVVDLLSILPSYVGLLNVTGLKIVRVLRVLRVLRILKLAKTAALNAELTAQRSTGTLLLDLQIYFIALFSAMTVSATLVWFAEREANPEFANIPGGLWFAIVTLTTTGSGAPIPVTIFGKLIAAFTMLTGLALFGVLASVIGRAMLSGLFGAADEDADLDPA